MTCVAIDDEPLALQVLQRHIEAMPDLELLGTFDDAVEGVEFLDKNAVDLLFLDVDMPDISGLELVGRLNVRPMVIFTTAHKKYAYEGFELEAVDYLLKPIVAERFEKAVQKAAERYLFAQSSQMVQPEFIIVRSEYKVVKIIMSEIEYIEGMEDYIKIHLTSSRHPVLTLMSLKGILEDLPARDFSRIHRSYIVANALVKSIQNKKVRLETGSELPIGESYLQFIEKWKNR